MYPFLVVSNVRKDVEHHAFLLFNLSLNRESVNELDMNKVFEINLPGITVLLNENA